MLTQQDVEITSKGEIVTWRIGNVPLNIHYERALSLSDWMREEASNAKQEFGYGRTARGLGVLEDLGKKPKLAPRADGPSIHVKDKTLQLHRRNVTSQGSMVYVKEGRRTISLHFEDALKISQWLRLRAKECRNTAGDVRHWSDIAGDAE